MKVRMIGVWALLHPGIVLENGRRQLFIRVLLLLLLILK